MAETLLEVKDLEISFFAGKRQTRVTDGVSFTVNPGEIVCLVGESGCGKSVTALSVLGLLARQGRVTGGDIRFGDRSLLNLTEKQLDEIRGQDIAMIFQDIMYSLNPVFTIGSQMVEGMRRHLNLTREEAVNRAVELLEKTGIQDAAGTMRKYPHQLSGGQRQRVMIAMALSCKPYLLIADEPTTALDVTIQLQIMELLRRLRDEAGMAILLITHDIGVVAEMADRVVVMYAGQCVEEADVETLLTQPKHPYTRALLQAVPGLHDSRERRLYAIPGTVPERYDNLPGCRFAPRCPLADQCDQCPTYEEAAPGHRVRCMMRGAAGQPTQEGSPERASSREDSRPQGGSRSCVAATRPEVTEQPTQEASPEGASSRADSRPQGGSRSCVAATRPEAVSQPTTEGSPEGASSRADSRPQGGSRSCVAATRPEAVSQPTTEGATAHG